MTTIEFEQAHQPRNDGSIISTLAGIAAATATGTFSALRRWNKQRRDRAAFMTLVGKEEWVYRDLGISRGDVEWAARQPMHVNAAKELEEIRMQSRRGW